jgi:hypothetical protein
VAISRFRTIFFSDPATVSGHERGRRQPERRDEALRTVERLRESLATHYSDERSMVFDSRSWLITARRRR